MIFKTKLDKALLKAEKLVNMGNYEEAFFQLDKFRNGVDLRVLRALGDISILMSKGNKQVVRDGLELLGEAAELGDAYSILYLAKVFYNGEIVEKDYLMAYEFAFMLSETELADAHYILAGLYSEGLGTEKNEEKAMQHFLLAKKIDPSIYLQYKKMSK